MNHAVAFASLASRVSLALSPSPQMRVELCDEELPEELRRLASCDVSLGEQPRAAASGTRRVVLTATSGALKDVSVAFTFGVRDSARQPALAW